MIRVVFDANVLSSALISSRGSPATILSAWQERALELIVSQAILREVERVIHYPRIQERCALPEEVIARFLTLLQRVAIVVDPEKEIDAIGADPSDNRYLEAALTGGAAYVVSGDGHLLSLEAYQGIRILTPAAFVALLKLEGQM